MLRKAHTPSVVNVGNGLRPPFIPEQFRVSLSHVAVGPFKRRG
jgi:hypothetical protein